MCIGEVHKKLAKSRHFYFLFFFVILNFYYTHASTQVLLKMF